MIRRILCWVECRSKGHDIKTIMREGSLSLVQCRRCGCFGGVHSAETPDGKFLSLSRKGADRWRQQLETMRKAKRFFSDYNLDPK